MKGSSRGGLEGRSVLWCTVVVAGGWVSASLHGESPDQPIAAPRNLEAPTLGGMQFWADVHVFHDWRIQRNCLTDHCRLLDGHDVRLAWGTEVECRARLAELRAERGLPPMKGRAVVLLHGLFGTRHTMDGIAGYLREHGDFVVISVGYPSTRADIDSHAANLAGIVKGLDGIDEINFVAHSMGNLVIRRYLAVQSEAACGRVVDPRIRRIVMLAPPNHGSALAEALDGNMLFDKVAGPSAVQIARIGGSAPVLATPACEFGILAGGRSNRLGYCPLLSGDDDGVVPVASTRLAGASDFAVLPVMHCAIMDDPQAQERTLRFLDHGWFVSADERQPIAAGE